MEFRYRTGENSIFFHMGQTIIYIIVPKEQKRRKKWRLFDPNPVKVRVVELTEELQVIRAEASWDSEALKELPLRKLRRQIQAALKKSGSRLPESPEIWYSPSAAEFLEQYPERYPMEFLLHAYHSLPGTDTVYIRPGKREEPLELVREVFEDWNRLVVWLEPEESDDLFTADFAGWGSNYRTEWEELAEAMYEHSGLLAKLMDRLPPVMELEKDKWKREYRPVFLDFSKSEQVPFRDIPRDTVYADFVPSKKKRRILQGKRPDITYVTYANFLDSKRKDTV